MDRRAFLQAGLASAALSLVSTRPADAGASPNGPKPNILWVLGDQHRAQALSCVGETNLSTPNLDQLASEGRHFTHAVSGMPLCCPFRGSMLSGRYPHVCVPGHEYPLPSGTQTIVQPLKQAGYHTGYFGKWHLNGWHERDGRAAMHIVPPERRFGFDDWIGYENNNAQYDCWVHGGAGDGAFHYKLPIYETDALTDLFIKYLRDRAADAKQGKPFFGVLSVQPPHDPYVAPPEYMARHQAAALTMRPNVPDVKRVMEQARREYAGACAQIENLDWNFGRIRSALAETGLDQNTYIFYFSDHGDMHGSHGQFRKMTPYEEAIRVPMIIAGGPSARRVKAGRDSAPMNHVDIPATTLGLAGLARPDWMQGTDYAPRVLDGRESKEDPDSAYLQSVVPTMHGDSIDRPWRGVVTRDGWKYVCLKGQPWMMFNLKEDPYEQVNLANNTKFKAARTRLHKRLVAWMEQTGDRFDLPKIS